MMQFLKSLLVIVILLVHFGIC